MTKKTLIPLLCLCLFAFSASARPAFQPVSKFDASELLGVKWYEFFYADNLTDELYACVRQLFHPIGNGKVVAQYGQYYPGLNGAFSSGLTIAEQQGNTGTFALYDTNNTPLGYVYILDFDPCYEWYVYGFDVEGDENDEVVINSKGPLNLVALQRAIDLAAYYDFESHHLELQTSKCDYNNIFYQLKKQRKSL
jgi:hypothetical protein